MTQARSFYMSLQLTHRFSAGNR